MNKILSKKFFSDNVAELVVEAPLIARSRRAGHFVIIRVDDHSERVPLTIADADIEKGTISPTQISKKARSRWSFNRSVLRPTNCWHSTRVTLSMTW